MTEPAPPRTRLRRPSVGPALLLAGLFGIVVSGPLIVGIPEGFDSSLQAVAAGAALGFSAGLLAILSLSESQVAQKVVWAAVTVCLSVVILDVGLRPFTTSIAVEPDRTYDWSPMPLVKRFAPNLRYRGTTYGGLAAEAGLRAQAQVREYTFLVDQYGFRNDHLPRRPLDVITIGDSFTAGHGITQDKVWPAALSKWYGLNVYNLGISGDGPWQDYANLLMEMDRLPLKDRGSVVVWNLYNGALFRQCDGIFEKQQLPWRTGLGRVKTSFKNFRVRSALGQMVPRLWAQARAGQAEPNTRDIIVRQFPNGTQTFFASWDRFETSRDLESVRTHPDYGCVKRTILAVKGLAQSKHLGLGVLSAPTKDEVYSWLVDGRPPWSTPPRSSGLARAVSEICKEAHIPYLDLTPPLQAAAKRVYQDTGAQLYWRDDTHWSVDGNKEVARLVYQFYMSVLRSGDGSAN